MRDADQQKLKDNEPGYVWYLL